MPTPERALRILECGIESNAFDKSKKTAATFAFESRSLCQSVIAEMRASWVVLDGQKPNRERDSKEFDKR